MVKQPEPQWPGWRTILRTCQVCAWTSPRRLRDDDPATAAEEHAEFTRQHVAWHLEASGRAGRLLVADAAQATHQPAVAVA